MNAPDAPRAFMPLTASLPTRSSRIFIFLVIMSASAALIGCGPSTPSNDTPTLEELCDLDHPDFPPASLPSGENARACFEDLECTDVYVSAHRGNRRYGAPENSLRALLDATRDGIPFVEIDLRTTADGVVINMHDASLRRTTGRDDEVNDVTWEEIQDLPLHSTDGVTHQIPTFEATLQGAKKLGVALYLDLKDIENEVLVEHLQRHDALNIGLARVTSLERLIELHTLEPAIWMMYSVDNLEDLRAARDAVPTLMLVEVPWGASPALIQSFRDEGVHVQQDVMATGDLVWAARKSPMLWLDTLRAGVQLPQSDRPGELVSVVCGEMGRWRGGGR